MRMFLLLTVLVIAGVGCSQRSVDTVESVDPRAHPDFAPTRRIVTDSTLARTMRIVNVAETTVGSGTLKVQVRVTNTSGKTRGLNYRFEWFDDAGMIIDAPASGWRPMRVSGGETVALVGVAPGPQAVDFNLKLMEAKR